MIQDSPNATYVSFSTSSLPHLLIPFSNISLPRTLEKEPHDKNLQSCHTNHHQTLDHTEIKDPPLGTPHCAEIPVLARAEILLVTCDG